MRASNLGTPFKKRDFCYIVDQSSKRTVADRHRLAAYHNEHCMPTSFPGYKHRWPLMTVNSLKKPLFLDFTNREIEK